MHCGLTSCSALFWARAWERAKPGSGSWTVQCVGGDRRAGQSPTGDGSSTTTARTSYFEKEVEALRERRPFRLFQSGRLLRGSDDSIITCRPESEPRYQRDDEFWSWFICLSDFVFSTSRSSIWVGFRLLFCFLFLS